MHNIMKNINNEYNQFLELQNKYEQIVRKYFDEHPETIEKFNFITRILFGKNYIWVHYERTDYIDSYTKIPVKDILNA